MSGAAATDSSYSVRASVHAALVLQVPCKVGEQDRITLSGQFQHAAIVVFADLRPVGLGHDHAHQVMRLWVFRRDAHGVAGMAFGFGQIALAQQDQSELVGGDKIVGIERDDRGGSAPRQRVHCPRTCVCRRGPKAHRGGQARAPGHPGKVVRRFRSRLGGAPGSRALPEARDGGLLRAAAGYGAGGRSNGRRGGRCHRSTRRRSGRSSNAQRFFHNLESHIKPIPRLWRAFIRYARSDAGKNADFSILKLQQPC